MKATDRTRRIALVTPWFGRELIGGAERLAWELSHALARAGADVDVLSTTCRSFHDDWGANYHRAGTRVLDGVTVRRFKVDSRDRAAFSRANAKIMALPRISLQRDVSPLPDREAGAFFVDNINAAGLQAYLAERGDGYDAVLFVPYLYGTTVNGVRRVADRAFIVPCLHDEAYAYLNPIRATIAHARGLLFNSAGEAEVAGAIFGPALYAKASIVGHAVEPVEPPRFPITIGAFTPHRSRYLLYLGRQDRTKNVDFLLDAFRRFREVRVASSLQLVLAGPRAATARTGDGVIALGTVAPDVKASLLTYARALVQPSLNESFSRAIFESWSAGRPVIAHADCRATARAVEECGGGWSGASLDDWVRIFSQIDEAADDVIDAIGARGRAAARENGGWDDVAVRTLAAIDRTMGRTARDCRIDQLVPLAARSVTAYAVALGDALRGAGADASVQVAETYTPRPTAQVVVHAEGAEPGLVRGDALIAHDGAAAIPAGTVAVFAANVPTLQALAERGYSARLLPPAVDPGAWAHVRPAAETRRVDEGRVAILSIAPLAKADVEWLIDMLVALIGILGAARLLVPSADCAADALATLRERCRELDLEDFVSIVGSDIEERYAALRVARVAVSFGQPLADARIAVDPLWFDVPVIAFDDPIVREAIEPCGLIVEDRDPRNVAAIIKVVTRDRELRRALISEGRRVRARYAPETVASLLLEAVGEPETLPAFNRSVRL